MLFIANCTTKTGYVSKESLLNSLPTNIKCQIVYDEQGLVLSSTEFVIGRRRGYCRLDIIDMMTCFLASTDDTNINSTNNNVNIGHMRELRFSGIRFFFNAGEHMHYLSGLDQPNPFNQKGRIYNEDEMDLEEINSVTKKANEWTSLDMSGVRVLELDNCKSLETFFINLTMLINRSKSNIIMLHTIKIRMLNPQELFDDLGSLVNLLKNYGHIRSVFINNVDIITYGDKGLTRDLPKILHPKIKHIKTALKNNRTQYEDCKYAVERILLMGKFGKEKKINHAILILPMDIIKIIARMVWRSRFNDCRSHSILQLLNFKD